MDGTTGFAKINEQKQRKIDRLFEKSGKSFDKNKISPGTNFMK